MAKELYVGHISEQATEEDLRKLFEVMGVVTSVHLIVDQDTGEFKRCGYVRMLSEVNLNEVVETLDGTWLIDRCIVVSIAKPQKDRPAKTPFVKRRQLTSARPAASAAEGGAPARKRPVGEKSAKPARPAQKEAGQTGRSSAAREAAGKRRPAASNDTARGERTAPSGKRTSAPTSAKRPPAGARPVGRGRK